jgi:uncharacterized protein YndB with AHSA1/START domain
MATAEAVVDGQRSLRMTRHFNASSERVFRAFAEPAQLVTWWGPSSMNVVDHDIDVRVGGAWRTVIRSEKDEDYTMSGVYREISPHHRLVFTWGWERDGERGHETLVTIELAERNGGTELTLLQETFESEEMRDSHRGGWSSSLDCLAEALNSGTAPLADVAKS